MWRLTFTYDPFHRRLSKTFFSRQGGQWKEQNTVLFLYDGQREIGAATPLGAITELRILGNQEGAESGAALAIELQGKLYAPLHDLCGNVACLIDAQTGTVTDSYNYTAFGEEVSSQKLSPWRYASKRIDDETGLVNFGRRYYDSSYGRFLTPDPAGFTDGLNLYAFARNNPLVYRDAYGLFAYGSIPLENYAIIGSNVSDMIAFAFINPQFQGSLQALGGLVEAGIGAGLTAGSSGYLAFVGVPIMAHGLDHYYTGMKTAISGIPRDTVTSQLLQKTGMSQETAGLIDGGLSIASCVGGVYLVQYQQSVALAALRIPESTIISLEGLQGGQNFKPFTRYYYRANLMELTGVSPPGTSVHAHHVFAQQFERDFIKNGINIHDPKYLTWWEAISHRMNARQYNFEWREFMKNNPNATTIQLLEKGKELMSKHGINTNY